MIRITLKELWYRNDDPYNGTYSCFRWVVEGDARLESDTFVQYLYVVPQSRKHIINPLYNLLRGLVNRGLYEGSEQVVFDDPFDWMKSHEYQPGWLEDVVCRFNWAK
jgi:hypothetical protein